MTMNSMIEYLTTRGFDAKKKYIAKEQAYDFAISRPGRPILHGRFKYPVDCHDTVKHDLQMEFLNSMTGEYERSFGDLNLGNVLKNYIEADVAITAEIAHVQSHSIKNVIFNDPATIVFWHDGTKTVVKCDEYDIFDPEKGLAMAISKKFLGNQGNYYNEIRKWVGKYDVEPIYPETKYINFPLSNDLKKAFEAIIDKRISDKHEKEWKK